MALENKILSVQQGVAEALGGMGLPELDSVSLRLRKWFTSVSGFPMMNSNKSVMWQRKTKSV